MMSKREIRVIRRADVQKFFRERVTFDEMLRLRAERYELGRRSGVGFDIKARRLGREECKRILGG